MKRIRIYRRRQGQRWPRKPAAAVDGGTHTHVDRGLRNGRRYFYRLRAVSRSGRWSKLSRSATTRPRRGAPANGTPIPGSGPSPSPIGSRPSGTTATPVGAAAAAPPAPPIVLGGPWSWDARNMPLDPNNASLAPRLIANVDRPAMTLTDWGVATADAKAGDPEYPIPRTQQGGSTTVRIPLGTKPDPSGDGHL